MNGLSQKIDTYAQEITARNYRNFKSFAFGGMVLTGAIALTAIAARGHMYFTPEYCILFALFVVYNLYVRFFLKDHTRYTVLSFYVAMAPILAIGILMGTYLDPESNAMTVMIMLCTLFMFITDKPLHILGYIAGTSVLFLACSYHCKTTGLFVSDIVNLAIYLSIGIGVNMLTLRDRVDSAENYVLAMNRASNDTLTAVLNRGAGDALVKNLLGKGQTGAFIIADIDDFKHINDTHGHQVGDEVICAVSEQLKCVFRGADVVWRLGGDEFAVFAVGLVDKDICEKRLQQAQAGVAGITTAGAQPLQVQISLGCCICRTPGCAFDDAYKAGDDALYEAKNQGKNSYIIREL